MDSFYYRSDDLFRNMRNNTTDGTYAIRNTFGSILS